MESWQRRPLGAAGLWDRPYPGDEAELMVAPWEWMHWQALKAAKRARRVRDRAE